MKRIAAIGSLLVLLAAHHGGSQAAAQPFERQLALFPVADTGGVAL
jgi:hypothetical protein